MHPRKNLLAFSIIFQVLIFFACCPNVRGEYRFDSWTTDDGLPQNGLREITQTPDGYLWFTTFDGLVRFDGVKFTTFNKGNTKGIANSRFTGIYCGKDGILYATTMEDGVLTTYKKGVFNSYPSEQVPGHYIEKIKPDENGELRFLAVEGNDHTRNWYYMREGRFVLAEKLDKNNPLLEYTGKSGTVWTLTSNQITEARGGGKTVYPYKIERFDGRREVFEDRDGGLWISGVNLIRLKDGKIYDYSRKLNFPKNSDFHSFREEPDGGGVWFANGGRSAEGLGLVRFRDGEFSIFGKESGLSGASIYSVFTDREGVVWLATNKGLNRLRKKIIKSYGAADGLRNSEVYPVYRDRKDDIWIGTMKGVSRFRNGKFENVNFRQGDKNAPEHLKWKNDDVAVQSLLEDSNGRMWIGASGGIYVAEKGAAKMLRDSESHHVNAIFEDKNGNIWAATSKGVLLYKNYKLQAFYNSETGLPNDYMNVIFEDSRGRLWFGGLGGLSEFKNGSFINYTAAHGLSGNYVRSIYEDAAGVLWIGTYGEGLSRFKNDRFFSYKKEDGLFSNDVFTIQEDARGYFWITSNHGIYRVRRQDLNDYADGKIERISSIAYGKEDGMLNNECNGGRQPASLVDKDGNFWFPTQDGIAVVNPRLENYNPFAPPVIIESVTVEREPVAIGQNILLEAGQQNIEINFTAISLIKSGQIKFKYKLEGHDKDWIDAGARRTVHYSNLPPGSYRFSVKAANSDGVWNETGASLEIKMSPFFYQTVGFYYLCVAVGILFLFTIWKISVHQLESRERRLAKLVAEKTEELRRANEELRHLANSDGLTSVGNRRSFEEFLSNEWHRAVRFKTEISLILLDIDHFKLFNDTYGHQAGDECLKKVADALKQTIHRPTDFVARFGGEEFAVILGGTDAEGTHNIAAQILENINNLNISHAASKTCAQLTVSIGAATALAGFESSETDLIKSADKALYRAKENGRNQIMINDVSYAFVGTSVLEEEFLT